MKNMASYDLALNSHSGRKKHQFASLLIEGNGVQFNKKCVFYFICTSEHSEQFWFSMGNIAVDTILHTFDENTYILHTKFLKKVCIHA